MNLKGVKFLKLNRQRKVQMLWKPKDSILYLVDEFEHSALDFVVTAGSVVESSSTDGVDFVEENLKKENVVRCCVPKVGVFQLLILKKYSAYLINLNILIFNQ
jgi:hypothetical protein